MSAANVVSFPRIADNWKASGSYMGFDPLALTAESACLGACLINPLSIHEAVDVLGTDSGVFYSRDHQHIYECFLALWSAGKAIDVVAVIDHMNENYDEDKPKEGWPVYLAETAGTVPTSAHVRQYAELVMKRHRTLESVEACKYLAQHTKPEEVISQTAQRLNALTRHEETRHVRRVAECATPVIEELEAYAHGATTSARATDYPELDTRLRGGLHEGEMTVLAGRPSHGKSALAMNIAFRVASTGTPVLFFSLEMSRESIVNRLLGIHGGVNMRNIQNKWQIDTELRKARNAENALKTMPFYIDDSSNLDVARITARAASFAQKHPKCLFVVDYLQLIRAHGKFSNREAEVSTVSRALKAIAKDTKTPLLCACQLSRESEKEKDHYRKLAYLRESGSIEQDADLVLILSRLNNEEVKAYTAENVGTKERLEESCVLCIAKQRNGPIGKVLMHFNKWNQRFSVFDDDEKQNAPEQEDMPF